MAGKVAHEFDEQSWLYRPCFPDEWKRMSLLSMARWVNGLAFRDFQFSETGKPVIKIAEVKGGITGQTKFTNQAFEESVFVRNGDMLFSWSGQPETSIDVFWWRGRDGWLNQHIFKVTPIEELDPVFFFYVLRYLKPNFIGIARNKQTTGLGHVTRRDIENIEAAFPPLAEQKAIAAVLGALDDKIELNRRMNATLEAMARALFQSWFVDFDPVRAKMDGRKPAGMDAATAALFPSSFQDSTVGHIPHGWKVGVLEELTKFVIGGDWGATEPTDDETVSCYCIRGADIPSLQSGGVGKMPTRFLKPSSVEKRQLADGDLAIEISGGSPTQCTGRPVLASHALLQRLGQPLVASNFCRILKLESPALSKFVYLWLRRLYDAGELFQFETGTTGIKNFAFVIFSERYPLVVPDLRVAEAFDRTVSPFFACIQANSEESRTLATLRDTLLPKLLSGELSVAETLSSFD
jgi:type I restriction enzyme S subunit